MTVAAQKGILVLSRIREFFVKYLKRIKIIRIQPTLLLISPESMIDFKVICISIRNLTSVKRDLQA